MNIDTFTDEQLLNLVNNSILEKTQYKLSDFTGGSVQITMNSNKKQNTAKVYLLFGYKNRNSQSHNFEIKEELIFIWIKAIKLKTEALKIENTGMDFNELNGLMNSSYDSRTNSHLTLPLPITNYLLPITSSEKQEIKGFKDLKLFLQVNNKTPDNSHLIFKWKDKEVCISDRGIAYFKAGKQPNLDFKESDAFYKYLFNFISGED